MLGLCAYFYACLHLMICLWLDQFFDWQEILPDVLDRPFVTMGMLVFALLIPLAVTSNRIVIKRLGKSRKKLHRLAYLLPALGVVHYWWLVKADVLEPLVYGLVLLVLLVLRSPLGGAGVATKPAVSGSASH